MIKWDCLKQEVESFHHWKYSRSHLHSSGEYYSILTVCETKKTWKCDFNLESNPSEPQPLLNDFIIYNLLVSPNGFKDQVQASEMENFSVFFTIRENWLEKAMAPHSSALAWRIPWTEEPGRLQSMRLLRVRHDWVTSLSLFTFMHWRRKWQPTPVLLPGESQGWGSLVGCRLWGCTESDTTEVT